MAAMAADSAVAPLTAPRAARITGALAITLVPFSLQVGLLSSQPSIKYPSQGLAHFQRAQCILSD
jgi:hypothetical protein